MIGFYYAVKTFGGGIKSRMKNDSEIEPKIYFRQDVLHTTQIMHTKQLQAVLTDEDEIRSSGVFIWILGMICFLYPQTFLLMSCVQSFFM
jgi:hypothetical protein